MCRHLAHVGPPVPLASLLSDAPHSLCDQARAPRHQAVGRTNPDGWGVAWYPDGRDDPELHRSVSPIWDDEAEPWRHVRAPAVIAAARLASPGTRPSDPDNNAPFTAGRWAFSLNGFAFRDGREHRLRAALPASRAAALVGDTDSEVLFQLLLARIDDGADPSEAMRAVHGLVAPDDDVRVNLLLTDGREIVATAWGNSLFALRAPDRCVVASEPLDDDPRWTRVPDRSLVDATGIHPLETRSTR